jgi:hypothetical protein
MNNSGITNFNVLNTNALYIQGIKVDFGATNAYLQGEIDAIEQQLVGISAITNRIDFNQPTPLVGNLVITEENKNSVLLTAIQNINTQIGSLNKLDLTALPAVPAGACVITPTTTNQALKVLIDNIDVSGLDKFDLTAIPAVPAGAIIITPTTTNQALKGLIDTNTGAISTINGQITTINNSITAINTKLAHFSTFTYGSDTMSGIADGTGFAAAVSGGSQSGNGIFVYPNNSSVGSQIQLLTAYDKDLLIRGGNKTAIYAGNDGTMLSRNVIDIGDVTDRISIGRNQVVSLPPKYSLISIGVDTSIEGSASTTEVEGDIYFSSYAFYPAGVTPCLVAETTNPAKLGNTNNYSSDLTLTGLDVTGSGIAPITLTAVTGAIPISCALGLISLTALAGGITLATGAGVMTINCGAGGFFLNSGVGVMNFASGSGNINSTTITGDIVLGAGKAVGGTAGNTILNALQKVIIQPDGSTEIYKAQFVELNDISGAPAITANRLYQQDDALYWNGQLVQGGGGNQYVLKAGDTMTGTLNLPEANTSILTLQNLTTAPVPVTNRLYLLNNVLTFNGVAIGSGGGAFVPLAGGTMTGALGINYNAGNNVSQLALQNTSTTAPTSTQGSQISLANAKTGNGLIGDRCGNIVFQGKDSVGAGGRSYASIQSFVNDPTSTATDGRLSSYVTSNGAMTEMLRLVSTSTSVRQVNIGATNTIIGATAIGASTTDALRVQGSTSITTTLDVPLIQNAPAIYPATSTTLVDGAVKQYRPERVFRLNDYPSPLSGPSIDGEKVIVLNSGGNPANVVDSILQSSDFPTISGATFVRILQSKYVEATNASPPMNVITAVYNEPNQRVHVFVQPDTAGLLSLTRVATLYFSQGQALVTDFCVTTFQGKTRIYAGGQFGLCDTPSPYAATTTANNFSGQIVVSWSAGTISNIVCNPMTSNAGGGDAQGAIWGGVNGVDDDINCLIDATGYSGISQPPTTGLAKYDTIVIGGDFVQVGPSGSTFRPLRRLAYYDWFNGNGNTITLLNQPPPITFNQVIGSADLTAQFTIPSAGDYNITASQMSYSTTNPSGYSASFGIYLWNGNTSSSQLISSLFPFTLDGDTTPNKTFTTGFLSLTPQTLPNYYYVRCNTGGPDIVPLDCFTGLQNNTLDLRCCVVTAVQAGPPVGWRAFQNDSWATPEGPDGNVYGGALFSNGALAFAYNATTITILQNPSSFTSNYAFVLQYSNGTSTFSAINSDPNAIASGQAWNFNNYNRNCVTGGNPVLAFGEGNAIAYGEVYFNTGNFNSQSTAGVSYRPTSQDSYEPTDALVVNSQFSLSSDQLKPQFSSQPCYAVYRDDTKYQGVFFIARGNELSTATLPFQQGIPNYNSIQFNSQSIPCFSFGGYSDEVGYVGALFVTNTNLFLYKLTSSGELVIDLSGCVVRTFNDVQPSIPIVATNKLTFPAFTDGGSVLLCGDTSTSPVSWWAISQDGPLYYDNTLIGGSGGAGGVNSVTGSGAGISITPTTGAVVVSNTGVTELTAGSGIAVSAQTGQVTLTTQTGYAKWFIDSNNLVIIENVATGQGVEAAYPFPAPTSTTGIGSNFVVGGGGRIRWTGANPIAISGQLSIQATLQHFQNGSWFNVINISQLPNQQPALVGFGARILVTDSNGNANTNSPACYNYFLNQTSSIDIATNPAPIGGLVGSMTFNTNMRTNDELYVIFITNGAFNTGTASQYRILFGSNILSSTNGGISFNITEMPFT